MQEQFTMEETTQLLAINSDVQDLQLFQNSNLVRQIMDICTSLPFAVALVASMGLKSQEKLNEFLVLSENRKSYNQLTNNLSDIYHIIAYNIGQLSAKHQQLFYLLGAFKRVPVALDSIQSLWASSNNETITLVQELNDKSLLTYISGNR